MEIREEIEQAEKDYLSPFATLSVHTKGRERFLEPCPIRTCFQRDRDRIIHCKSFRRLKYKTQVFIAPEGDHYRSRLTHTLEVTQVARTLARSLKLNEDLTEAIALGHDLGHTPFGHIGEKTLNRLNKNGFRHNEQSLRVVDVLERNGEGLNLTWEVRNGILNHSGKEIPSTLEGKCVARADRIAYINHDIDDAFRAGVLRDFEIPQKCVSVLGSTHGERINTMILDIIRQSRDKNDILMSEEVADATDTLREFLFQNVYFDAWRKEEEKKCDEVISHLFDHYCQNPGEMPMEYIEIAYREGVERAVTDYIACMTDRYALRCYRQVFIPSAYPNL